MTRLPFTCAIPRLIFHLSLDPSTHPHVCFHWFPLPSASEAAGWSLTLLSSLLSLSFLILRHIQQPCFLQCESLLGHSINFGF